MAYWIMNEACGWKQIINFIFNFLNLIFLKAIKYNNQPTNEAYEKVNAYNER